MTWFSLRKVGPGPLPKKGFSVPECPRHSQGLELHLPSPAALWFPQSPTLIVALERICSWRLAGLLCPVESFSLEQARTVDASTEALPWLHPQLPQTADGVLPAAS